MYCGEFCYIIRHQKEKIITSTSILRYRVQLLAESGIFSAYFSRLFSESLDSSALK